ncbi:hypothetical protein KFE98_14585 [bacterium SCSIO 12741]|nr:hypothetical protein KFE98_14585 [bacterium SCSIO 12741]
MKYLAAIGLFLFPIFFLSCQEEVNTPSTSQTIGQEVEFIDPSIWAIFQDQNKVYWLGSKDNGVYRYDGKGLVHYTQEDGLVSDQIRGIQSDSSGHLFFDTSEGISRFDGNTFTTLVPMESDEKNWKIEPGDLWFNQIGLKSGVFRYDGENLYHLTFPDFDWKERFGYPMPDFRFGAAFGVYGIHQDKAGNMWFGTPLAGVIRFDGESFLWIAEKELTELEDGRVPGIRFILEDKQGDFWLSHCLNRYEFVPRDPNNPDSKDSYLKKPGVPAQNGGATLNFPIFFPV